MIRNRHKKFNGTNCFTDFKHHSKSWHNNKRLRAKMLRRDIKEETKAMYDEMNNDEIKSICTPDERVDTVFVEQ